MNKRMLRGAGQVIRGVLAIGWMAALCCGPLADSAVLGADEPAAQRAADLAPPVLVMAGGKPIDVDGYAAPFVGDFDGDGKNDLLVGQYVYGKLRIYRNVGTNAEPKFDRFEWFTVGGLPACVPAGCYVGFTPQLVDFDGDGRTDILTGSFPGVHFLFRRNSDGTFAQAEVLRDKHGEIQFGYPERHRYNSTVFALDWDQDGDLDLLLGRHIYSLVANEGNRRQPVFGDAVPLKINGERIPGGTVPPCVADWDGDGRDDLLIGRVGDIVWYRNTGEKGRPVLAAPQILVPGNSGTRDGPRGYHAICVADFNGDGRLDLLLGDRCAEERPEPTAAQRAKDEETAKMKNQLWSEWSRLTADRPQGETVQEHDERWKKALRSLQELAATDPDGTQSSGNLRSKRHGHVWLYARTAAGGSKAPESPSVEGAVQDDPKADPLPAQSAVRLGTARYRHGSRIESMAVSADGRLAAVSSGVAWFSSLFWPARVFDLTDGRCLYSIPNERGSSAEAVGLSPDGKTLAIKDDAFLYFRDAATGKELRKLKYLTESGGGRSGTDWLTFTPDGKQVAVTLMGEAVQLIDVESAKVIRTFALGGAASACVFSPDGKWMATGGYGMEEGVYFVRLWNVGTGKELRRFPAARFPTGNGVKRALAFSPDGATLAGGGWGDARLRLWETATGKELSVFPKIGEDIRSVAFAPDGKTVAAAGDNIYLYDPLTGKQRLRIERRARLLTFNQDGSVLTGAVSGAIYRWDTASGRQLIPAAAQDSAVEQILVSADGRRVFTTDQDGDLFIWDAAGGESPRRIVGGVDRGVVASSDRRFLAWTVRDVYGNSRIRLYDVAADRVIEPVLRSSAGYAVIGGEACVAAFLPDGKSLLTLERGPATFRLWDLESGNERRSFAVVPPKSYGHSYAEATLPFCTHRRAALSPDGKMLAIGPDFPEGFRAEEDCVPVRLWNVATGKAGPELDKPMRTAQGPKEVGSETAGVSRQARLKAIDGRAFSPDGRFLVDWAEFPFGPSRIDHIFVWDVATGRAVATLAAGRRHGAANAAFAPDGRTLATASADGMVRLWDTATWTVRAEFRAHRDRVTAVAFGPDGRLFTGGLDTIVIGWDVQPPQATAINVMQERDKPTSKDLATTRPPGGVPLVPAGQGQGAIGATKE